MPSVHTLNLSTWVFYCTPLFFWECPEHSLQEKAGHKTQSEESAVVSGLSGYKHRQHSQEKEPGVHRSTFPSGQERGNGAWGEVEEYGGAREEKGFLGSSRLLKVTAFRVAIRLFIPVYLTMAVNIYTLFGGNQGLNTFCKKECPGREGHWSLDWGRGYLDTSLAWRAAGVMLVTQCPWPSAGSHGYTVQSR